MLAMAGWSAHERGSKRHDAALPYRLSPVCPRLLPIRLRGEFTMSSINTNVAAMTALQSLTADQQGA